MHILIMVLSVLGVVALWIWRMRAAADATREVADAAQDVRAIIRRFGFKAKAGRHPADLVDDPRLAAAGMMAAIARIDGDPTSDALNAIRVECRATFRVMQAEADDIAAFGRWLASQSNDPEDIIRRLSNVLKRIAPREAHEDMIAMLTRIAAAEGGAPSEGQRTAISNVRRSLDVALH